jgi:hypothetical protein
MYLLNLVCSGRSPSRSTLEGGRRSYSMPIRRWGRRQEHIRRLSFNFTKRFSSHPLDGMEQRLWFELNPKDQPSVNWQ